MSTGDKSTRSKPHRFHLSRSSGAKDETSSSGATEVLPEVKMERFFVNVAPLSTELGQAQEELHGATEKLEAVLQAIGAPSAQEMPSLKAELEDHSSTGVPKSLTALTHAWQADLSGSDKRLGAKVGRFFRAVFPVSKLALGITGDSASLAGFMPLQATANGLNQVFQLAMQPLAEDDLVKSGLETMSGDDSFLRELEQFPLSVMKAFMLMSAIKIQTALVQFLRTSLMWMKKNYFTKFIGCAVGRAHVQDAITELGKARADLVRSAVLETNLRLVRRDVQDLEANLLRNVCNDGYFNAQLDRQDDLHNKRAGGTGEWFLAHDSFSTFVNGAKSVLWCSGPAGSGKSFLTSVAIDHLESFAQRNEITLAYIYFQRERADQQSAESVLGAIIRHLLMCKPNSCFDFKDDLECKNLSVEKRQTLLESVVTANQHTILVIDALDEFSRTHSDRTALMKILADVAKKLSPGQFRILVTSREAPDIWKTMQSSLDCAEIPIHASSTDIAHMITKEIKARPEAEILMAEEYDDQPLIDHTIREIVAKSDGIFKLAELQLRRVLYEAGVDDVVECLENLGPDVNEYYSESILRIQQNPTSEKLIRLLTWVYYAKKPLHLQELAFALGIKGSKLPSTALVNFDGFISQLEGLLTLEPTTDKRSSPMISSAHTTVLEYFDHHQDILLPNGEDIILDACVAIWSCEPFSGILGEALSLDWKGLRLDSSPVLKFGQLLKRRLQDDNLMLSKLEHKRAEKAAPFACWACTMPAWLTWDRINREKTDSGLVKFLHDLGALRSSNVERPQPLDWCVWHDWYTLCRWLLAQDLGGDVRDRGANLLWSAIICKSLRTAEVLAATQCVNVNELIYGSACLVHSIEANANTLTEILLRRSDLDINIKAGRSQDTAIHASVNRNNEILLLLLKNEKININVLNGNGFTPLMYACGRSLGLSWYKEAATMDVLLRDVRLDIDARSSTGRTALSIAASGGFIILGHYRLSKGNDRETAITDLRECYNYLGHNVVLRLLEAGAKDFSIDQDGHSPIDYAYGYLAFITLLGSSIEGMAQLSHQSDNETKDLAVDIEDTQGTATSVATTHHETLELARGVIARLEALGAKSNNPFNVERLWTAETGLTWDDVYDNLW